MVGFWFSLVFFKKHSYLRHFKSEVHVIKCKWFYPIYLDFHDLITIAVNMDESLFMQCYIFNPILPGGGAKRHHFSTLVVTPKRLHLLF